MKVVLFDLDGTLLDTAPDFSLVLDTMMARRQRPPVPYEKVHQTVSDGARGLIEMAFGIPSEQPEFETLRQELLALYADHLAVRTRPFPGVDELLAFIEQSQLCWGVVTNKPARYAEPLLQALNLQPRCGALVCPDHVKLRKPHPESLLMACDSLKCAPADAIYVGDHRRDIECGRNAGLFTVAVRWGYIHPDDPCERWGADRVVDHPREIVALLQQRLNQPLMTDTNA